MEHHQVNAHASSFKTRGKNYSVHNKTDILFLHDGDTEYWNRKNHKKVQTSIRTDYGMYDIFGTKSGKLYTATSLMKLDTYVFSSRIGAL